MVCAHLYQHLMRPFGLRTGMICRPSVQDAETRWERMRPKEQYRVAGQNILWCLVAARGWSPGSRT